ncbi:MAG: GHMP kinase [Chloroflexi bacterium]|nr:GHMP kinase [Chloroflexota bacterium]
MRIIRKRAYARAGFLGNPSDGYHGKTISFILRNFWAEVVLYEWETVEIVQTEADRARFHSVYDLAQDVALHGYYGGIRLIKATIKRFVDYCNDRGITLPRDNFSIRYATTIPRQVGLAGSSAIITATLRALLAFYHVDMPLPIQPSFVLSVEKELGIAGGLQDRVVQCYEGLVYMDFSPEEERVLHGLPYYRYEPLDPALLPPVYVAYHTQLSEPTEVFHNNIRERYEQGDPLVVETMAAIGELAAQGREALLARDVPRLHRLVNQNFDLRRRIYRLPRWQVEMVEVARECGASAKFAGSGGAIVGLYHGEAMFHTLEERLAAIGSRVIRPQVTSLA